MPFVRNIPSHKKLRVRGQCQTVDATPFQIPLPQLPGHGAWRVLGTVLALNPRAPAPPTLNDSIAFRLAVSGNSVDGTVMRTDGLSPPYTTLPPTGGLPGAALSGSIAGQVLVLILNGTAAGPILWGWDLELNFLSMPF